MNADIFRAILSMDAYNRGYNEGIKFSEGDDVVGFELGDAVIVQQSDIEENSNGFTIGFYALAYTYNGEAVISYRGTDSLNPDPSNPLSAPDDVYHGWSLGTGNIDSEQGQMAIEFYQAVAGSGNWQSANISLTGHSLGGGLAGVVGGLYDQQAHIFDSMDYVAALVNFHTATSDPQSSSYDAATKP